MQKKMFLILSGLFLLISLPAAQTFGTEPLPADADADAVYEPAATEFVGGGWSAPIYHPEIGDLIVSVNNQRVNCEADFRRAVRNSSSEIILGVIGQRTGDFYQLRTRLWSPYNQTRLGIYIESAGNYNGVIVTGFVPDSPGMHCQYLRGETRPVYDGLYRNGGGYRNGGWFRYDGWFRNVDVDVNVRW